MSLESPKTPGVVSLQYVVASVLNELGDYTQTNYKRVLQMAVHGFSNLNMHALRSYDVVYLDVDSTTGQALLPPDFVDFCKVGCIIGGKLYVLTINREVAINRQIENGVLVNEAYNQTDEITSDPILFLPHLLGGSYNDTLYGLAYTSGYSTAIPMFNIDYENKIIQLSSSISTTKLVVEYVTTGVSLSGNTYIPRQAVDALTEYLHWRIRKNDSKYSRGEVMDAKQDFVEAEATLRTFESLPGYQEVMDAFYSTSKQTIKR